MSLLTTLAVSTLAPLMFSTDGPKDLSLIAETEPVVQQKVIEEVKAEEPVKPKVITHKVREGDTLSLIAEEHKTDWTRLWKKNTQLKHQDQLEVGEELTIPAEEEPLEERAVVAPPVVEQVRIESTPSSPTPQGITPQPTAVAPVVTTRASGGPNGYAYGWCTWWVKEKRPDIGGYWGNAGYNWISAAQSAGFSTGSAPAAGAIGVMPGHVVYVESVSGNMVNVSEMGWGYQANSVANYRSVPASTFTYIY